MFDVNTASQWFVINVYGAVTQENHLLQSVVDFWPGLVTKMSVVGILRDQSLYWFSQDKYELYVLVE